MFTISRPQAGVCPVPPGTEYRKILNNIQLSNKAELDVANCHEVSDMRPQASLYIILPSDNLRYPMMPSSITVLSYTPAHPTTQPQLKMITVYL